MVFDLSKTSTTSREPKLNDNRTNILTITDQLSSLNKTVEMFISANNNHKAMYMYQNHDMILFYSSNDDAINAHIFRYF